MSSANISNHIVKNINDWCASIPKYTVKVTNAWWWSNSSSTMSCFSCPYEGSTDELQCYTCHLRYSCLKRLK